MPTNYNGIPGNTTQPAPISIASTTNTNPIQVTVSGALPASFTTGVIVSIAGHTGNLAANGRWPITVTGPSTFTIPTAGSGIGVATGTVLMLGVSPLYTYPSDGDADNQASIALWAFATGDRTQYLASALSPYKMVGFHAKQTVDDTYGVPWGSVTINGTRQVFSGSDSVYVGLDVQVGDVVEYEFRGTITLPAQVFVAAIGIEFANYNYGSFPTYGIGRSDQAFGGFAAAVQTMPLTLRGLSFVDGSGSDIDTNGLIAMQIVAFQVSGAAATLLLLGSRYWTVKIWRPTGIVA